MSEIVQLNSGEVLAAANELVGAGDGVFVAASGLDTAVPELPEDHAGLRPGLLAFEEARATFERRFANGLHAAGARATGFVLDALAADGAAASFPLPAAAMADPSVGR